MRYVNPVCMSACAMTQCAVILAVQAARDCYAIRDIGPHRIAFLSCTRYNYCNLVTAQLPITSCPTNHTLKTFKTTSALAWHDDLALAVVQVSGLLASSCPSS